MLVRQLFHPETSTFTYLLADTQTREAALIDSVRENVDRDLKLIFELGLDLVYVLDTHIHADHVTGAGSIADRTGAKTVASNRGAVCADFKVKHGDTIVLGELKIEVLETPGHTDDSLSYRVGDNVFTGDALLIRGNGRTDFQNGDAAELYDSITQVLFGLPDDTVVWPGHDYKGMTSSTVGEEKKFNLRVAGRSRQQFVELMNALKLPPPRKLATAVPANRDCGRMRN